MNRILRIGTAIALSSLLSGCVTLEQWAQTASAGHTGCLPEANRITHYRSAPGGTTWNATCDGKVYLCSDIPGKNTDEIACAPAVDPSLAR